MQELIKFTEMNGQKAVKARDLHTFLGSKQDFSNWIKNRIKKYGFIENQDFQRFDNFIETGGKSIEYILSIDCAKELSMVENNLKGRQIRQYFIECEKSLKELAPLNPMDFLQMQLNLMKQQQTQIFTIERKVEQLETVTSTNLDCFTVAGFAKLQGKQVSMLEASAIGRKAAKVCKESGFRIDKIHDVRWGLVNIYPKKVLQQFF